jgi:hypothetical protein
VSRNEAIDYVYRDAVNGFFEIPTEVARGLLPPGLQPVELHHGTSILTVTAFEFSESQVGSYRELALSIIVPPRIVTGEAMPRAAMYPFQVGTTTPAARRHGMERWKLPHHPEDLEVDFERAEHHVRVKASAGGRPILELDVLHAQNVPWLEVEHTYQTFMSDGRGSYLSPLVMRGPFMESEEELGRLAWHGHPFAPDLDAEDIDPIPFREQWMRNGVESIHPLQTIEVFAAR